MFDIDAIQHRFDTFRLLMNHRIREILLVASVYDAYVLEEDGSLEERIWQQYTDRGLSTAPRIRKVSNEAKALEIIQNENIDMVIAVIHEEDESPIELASQVKTCCNDLPFVVLAMDPTSLSQLSLTATSSRVDRIFLWQNDPSLLVAIIKYFEDLANVDHDTHMGGVRVILLVEDSIVHYSTMLPAIYTAIMAMTRQLIDEGLNYLHKQLRMCSRAKILMAETYEDAVALFQRYRPYVLGLITDVHFSKENRMDRNAGFELTRLLRTQVPELPVCIHSANPLKNSSRALEAGTFFINKNSSQLTEDIQHFLRKYMGFGHFSFRSPEGVEIARAGNPRELLDRLKEVPIESILHHAEKQQFSHWMMARTELKIAEQLYPKRVSDFDDPEDMRTFLLNVIEAVLYEKQSDIITPFKPGRNPYEMEFMRQGEGMLGGKARGISFLRYLLSRLGIRQLFPDITIRMPPTLVVCSDEFTHFMNQNKLWDCALSSKPDFCALQEKFLRGSVGDKLVKDLRSYLETVRDPLAVRSSSLMEDSLLLPLAGLYDTYMLPNNEATLDERLESLLSAVKLVWASTFGDNPKAFFKQTSYRLEDERMAVVIQTLGGRQRGNYFYPTFSGVAQSHNFYPISYMQPEDGVTQIALGLGKIVMEGGAVVRFCPKYPLLLPQFSGTRDWLYYTQKEFFALDMTPMDGPRTPGGMDLLRPLELSEAETHRVLQQVSSVYQADSGLLVDSFLYEGPRIVTFQKVLRNSKLKIGELISNLLSLCEKAMRTPVELEFACDLAPDGQCVFYPLQLRPMAAQKRWEHVDILPEDKAEAFCYSDMAHGNGQYRHIHDLVCVKPKAFNRSETGHIAVEIGQMNKLLLEQKRPYALIGFGRWGSVDPWMGIGVSWAQISGVRVLVEIGLKDFNVDPAQGTHFFQNVTALNIGCLSIPDGSGGSVDWEKLDVAKPVCETKYLQLLRLDTAADIRVDGRSGEAVILLPD
jgi:hypothetical protein